jgi:hypothetical protein
MRPARDHLGRYEGSHMAKAAVKSKKREKPAKGKKRHRGMLDLPKAVATRMAEGRGERDGCNERDRNDAIAIGDETNCLGEGC